MNARDTHHAWAREMFAKLEPPVFTCEAVLTEVQHLLSERGGDPLTVLRWVRDGIVRLDFSVAEETQRPLQLQQAYRDVPMSLADACLVRMAELRSEARVLTIDSDFRLYRKNRRQIIPLLAPSTR